MCGAPCSSLQAAARGARQLRSGERPEPAEPFRLKAEESYTTAPGIDQALGHVFDQDTGNMEAQQQGFLTSRKKGATLGNYQEVRIRHLHQTLDKFLAMPPFESQ